MNEVEAGGCVCVMCVHRQKDVDEKRGYNSAYASYFRLKDQKD